MGMSYREDAGGGASRASLSGNVSLDNARSRYHSPCARAAIRVQDARHDAFLLYPEDLSAWTSMRRRGEDRMG